MSNRITTIVAYVRVSTNKQGASGLGLEAQTNAIDAYATQCGAKIVRTYREVESGRNNARPQLAAAIAHAKRIKGRLVIAKLDRLSRNVAFLATLMDSGIEFVCCDNQNATRLTLHILAAVAEEEARATSQRTKAALQAAKARGIKLGSPCGGAWTGREDAQREYMIKAQGVAAEKAREATAAMRTEVLPTALQLRNEGKTLDQIADALNEKGFVTSRGKAFIPMAVSRLLAA